MAKKAKCEAEPLGRFGETHGKYLGCEWCVMKEICKVITEDEGKEEGDGQKRLLQARNQTGSTSR